jgi:uncharacterized protein (TIGR02722 family)
MKKFYFLHALTAATGVLLNAGCASHTTPYVEEGSCNKVTTLGINIQDFAQAANLMSQSLVDEVINPGKLESSVPGDPALMAVSEFRNNTSQHIDMDSLVKKIRVALNKTGKVQTSTTAGLGGAEDPLAEEQQKRSEFFSDGQHARTPDYTLSGKIIEMREQAGSTRQVSYVFQLSLSSKTGVAVWEDEKTITKQGTAPRTGY